MSSGMMVGNDISFLNFTSTLHCLVNFHLEMKKLRLQERLIFPKAAQKESVRLEFQPVLTVHNVGSVQLTATIYLTVVQVL